MRLASLAYAERVELARIVGRQEGMDTADGLRETLVTSGLPEPVDWALRGQATHGERPSLEDVLDRLAERALRVAPWKSALGLFLAHATRLAEKQDRAFVARVLRGHAMPNVRHRLVPATVTRELNLSLEHVEKQIRVSTFRGIVRGRLIDRQATVQQAGGPPKPRVLKAVPCQENWQEWVLGTGNDALEGPAFKRFKEQYARAVGPAGAGEGLLGICIASGPPGLRMPVEWASLDGPRDPAGSDAPDPPVPGLHRASLAAAIEDGARGREPMTMRVLIAGANPGDLPWVDLEVESVKAVYLRWFAGLGWPASDVTALLPTKVTELKLKEEILNGGYHIFHFAGHGLTSDDVPALAIIDSEDPERFTSLPASILAGWIAESDLRLVYLGCCQSASGVQDESGATVRRFDDVAQAMVAAKVPEVVGFLWPVCDRQGSDFAEQFHRGYLGEFDASLAAFRARTAMRDRQIWAAPLVISQRDSPAQATLTDGQDGPSGRPTAAPA